MRRCPQCYRDYADDSLRFCLDDGAPLAAPIQTAPTQPAQTFSRNDPQTVVLPVYPFQPQPAKPQTSIVFILAALLAVCLVLLVAGMGVIAWLKYRETNTPPISNGQASGSGQKGTPTPRPSPTPATAPLAGQLGTWVWGTYMQTFSTGGRGTYYYESKQCFNFSYEMKGDVMRMIPDSDPKCASTLGGDYRLTITGDRMKQEYVPNGYTSYWTRVK